MSFRLNDNNYKKFINRFFLKRCANEIINQGLQDPYQEVPADIESNQSVSYTTATIEAWVATTPTARIAVSFSGYPSDEADFENYQGWTTLATYPAIGGGNEPGYPYDPIQIEDIQYFTLAYKALLVGTDFLLVLRLRLRAAITRPLQL